MPGINEKHNGDANNKYIHWLLLKIVLEYIILVAMVINVYMAFFGIILLVTMSLSGIIRTYTVQGDGDGAEI